MAALVFWVSEELVSLPPQKKGGSILYRPFFNSSAQVYLHETEEHNQFYLEQGKWAIINDA